MQHALYLAYTGQQLETRGIFICTQPELSIVICSNGKLELPCQEMEGVRMSFGLRACAQSGSCSSKMLSLPFFLVTPPFPFAAITFLLLNLSEFS